MMDASVRASSGRRLRRRYASCTSLRSIVMTPVTPNASRTVSATLSPIQSRFGELEVRLRKGRTAAVSAARGQIAANPNKPTASQRCIQLDCNRRARKGREKTSIRGPCSLALENQSGGGAADMNVVQHILAGFGAAFHRGIFELLSCGFNLHGDFQAGFAHRQCCLLAID